MRKQGYREKPDLNREMADEMYSLPDGEHGGGMAPDRIRLDFSVNTNPCGMPEGVRKILADAAGLGGYYPDITCRRLREKILDHERSHYQGTQSLRLSQIVAGNGASELIMALAHAYSTVDPKAAYQRAAYQKSAYPKTAVMLQTPLFSGYERAFSASGAKLLFLEHDSDFAIAADTPERIVRERPDIVVLCQPGNPAGSMIGEHLLEKIVEACRMTGSLLIVDECFIAFTENAEARSVSRFLESGCDLVILRAFTKLYAMPGLRLGYAVCADEKTAQRLKKHLPEWNVSGIAQAAGCAALEDEDYVSVTTRKIRQERVRLSGRLEEMGFRTVRGEADFILLRSDMELYEELLRRGILIRRCSNYRGMPRTGYYRIAVRLPEEDDILLSVLEEIAERAEIKTEE